MALNREIHRCHRCTFSICRLLPPSPRCFSFYLPVFAYCLHPFLWMDLLRIISVWAPAYLGFCWWCVLLALSSEAGHMGLGKKNKGGIWAEGQKHGGSLYRLEQPRLSELEPITYIRKERVSQKEKWRPSRFNKGFPPLHSHYRRTHIDWASTCSVWALFHLFEWETKERLFVVLAAANLHKAITACNL